MSVLVELLRKFAGAETGETAQYVPPVEGLEWSFEKPGENHEDQIS